MGQRIKQYAKQKGLSLRKLADNVGISYNTLYSITKRDSNNINGATVKKIADELGISDDLLYYGYEVDREYEQICDTLEGAGYRIEQGHMADEYRIFDVDAEDGEEPITIDYCRLAEIVQKVLDDAELNKHFYIQKRLAAELFWPQGWKPD